jgi:anti-sigma regulatory factor (Ser/Thr protein kinase)
VISHETVVYENSFPLEGRTFKNAGKISTQVKALLQKMKLPKEIVRRAAIVTYEAEINICSYAERGRIVLQVTPEEIIIEAIDEGQGIADIKLAMEEGYSTATEKIWRMGFGAGMGLSNIKNYSDSFHITSEVGKGTHLKMIIGIQKAFREGSRGCPLPQQ